MNGSIKEMKFVNVRKGLFVYSIGSGIYLLKITVL